VEPGEGHPDRLRIVHRRRRPRLVVRKKWIFIAGGIFLIAVTVLGVLLALHWPFTEKEIAQDLAEASSSKVEIQKYHPIYFPHPGGVAEGVVFRHGTISTPLISIERLTIRGTYLGLITKHISVLKAEGMRVVVPPFGTNGNWSTVSSKIVVDEFIADRSVLIVPSAEQEKKPLAFQFHDFSIHGMGARREMAYRASLTNPEPPGEIRAEGKIGPFKPGASGQSPVSGAYTFEHANLGVFRGISGMLSSKGSFRGTLREINVQGTTDTPDFSVTESGHQHQLDTAFNALVNATNGDVLLKGVNARLDHTTLVAEGSVAGQEGRKGKTTSLEIVVRNGHIQDLMLLFVSQKRSPLNGDISFHAETQIPPGQKPFFSKVRLRGDFGIDAAHFTNPQTQQSMNKLSKSAQGHPDDNDATRVLSGLKGHLDVHDGVANFTNLFFQVPGADVNMHGTFGLINERINLHGTMRMQAKPSQATTGVKSFLMKVLDPFTNKDRGRVPIPVSITGTYNHPDYSASTPK
jgi:hypothetical protein